MLSKKQQKNLVALEKAIMEVIKEEKGLSQIPNLLRLLKGKQEFGEWRVITQDDGGQKVQMSTKEIEIDSPSELPPILASLTLRILTIHRENGDLGWVRDLLNDLE